MKNVLVLLTVFAAIGTVNAALVPNGDFESPVGTAEGWDVWAGGGTVNAHEFTTNGNPDGYVDIAAAAGTWAGWYQQTPLPFAVLGAPAGSTITLQADIKNFGGNLNAAGLKLEAVGGAAVDFGERPGVTTSWATYSIDLVTNPGNTGLIFSLMTIPADAGGASTDGFDNAQLIVGGKALFPVPIVGAFLPDNTTALTWVNPDPSSPSDPVTATAYLLESEVLLNDPNLGPDVFDSGVVALDVDPTDYQSADTTGLLTVGKHYYWAVHVTDPNGGGPVTTQGFTWYFIATGDSVPEVNAGADQYLVTEGSGMILNLDATVTDDEDAGPVTITWADLTVAADKNPNTVVALNDTAIEDPTVTLTNAVDGEVTGYYIFEITVDDGVNPAVTDQVIVNVLGTCGEAADADPNDDYDITGDLNLDCKKDLADFAIFAAAWLDCNTNRPGDVTCP
jgi:hypothetical protein